MCHLHAFRHMSGKEELFGPYVSFARLHLHVYLEKYQNLGFYKSYLE